MPRITIVAAAFVLLFFGSVAVVTFLFLPVVERDLFAKVSVAMERSDVEVEDLKLDVQGRDVIVTGTVRRKAQLENAVKGLLELPGVASVENKLRWVPMDPWLFVERDADGVFQVTGHVKNRAEKARLGLGVREADDEAQLENKAKTDEDVREAEWMESLGKLLPELMAMDAVKSISVKDGNVEVKGEVYSDSTADATMGMVAAVFDGLDFRMDSDLKVVPPPLAPWIEIKKESPEKLVAKGTLRSTKQRHELIGIAASELEEGASISNYIETGGNVALAEWWSSVVTVLPAVLSEMQPCEIEIRNSSIRVTGNVESEPMRVSLTSVIEQNFPSEIWQRELYIEVVEPPIPSRLSVIVFSGDQIFLKGVLPSPKVKKRILDRAGRGVKGKEIVDQIELRKNAVEPAWVDSFSDFLPGYSENALRGGMTIDDDQLVIEARVESDAKWDALFALAEKHFPMSEFRHRIDLRVVDPTAPDPEDPLGPADPDALTMDIDGG